MFIELLKRAINNNSYFGIILDKQKDIALSSIQAINVWIGRRINHNIALKVSTTLDTWDSYMDSNGIFIEGIHDYGIVELDNSYQEYMKKLKKQ